MMKKIFFILFFLPSLLWAGEFRVLGFVDYYGGIEYSNGYENLRNRYQIRPEFQAVLFDHADFKVNADLWYQSVGDETHVAPENILREAFVSFPAGPFDFTLGQKLESFGFADLYSPLNVINGSSFRLYSLDDPYEGKRPDLMAQIQFYPGFDDTLELIYVPLPRPNWEPRESVDMDGKTMDARIEFDAQPYNTGSPHSLFARYYHFAPGFDLQLVYAWYTDQNPAFELSDTRIENGRLTGTIKTGYSKNHLFGGGISLPVRDVIFSEDLAFTMTDNLDGKDIGTRNSSITANSQVMTSFGAGIFAQMNIVYQYFLNHDADADKYGSAAYADFITEVNDYHIQPKEHIAFAVVHLHKSVLRDKLYLGINAAYLHPHVYLAPRISYAFSDHLKTEFGIDYISASPSDNSLIRGYDTDNFYLRLKYEY